MDFVIRKAKRSDIEKLAEIYCKSWQFAYKGIISDAYLESMSVDKRVQRFKAMKEIPEYVFLVNNEIIGCSRLIDSRDDDLSEYGEIQTLYFLPEFIGKGYGSSFLKWIIEKARSMGFPGVFVWCLSKNNRARRAYEKSGFLKDNERTIEIAGQVISETRYSIAF